MGGAQLRAELVGLAGVNSRQQRIDQHLEGLVAETATYQRPHGHVATHVDVAVHASAGTGGAGAVRIGLHCGQPGFGEQAATGQGVEIGGHAQQQSLGQGCQPALVDDLGGAHARADQLLAQPQVTAQLHAPRHPGQEAVGPFIEVHAHELAGL